MSKSILLDCESYESTLNSISLIFDIHRDNLINKISNVNVDDFYRDNPGYYENGNSALWELFNLKPKNSEYTVAWFHLTRVYQSFRTNDGLLPLHLSLDKIWQELYEIAKEYITHNEWINFKKIIGLIDSCFSELYVIKTRDRFDSGPFAMLNPMVGYISSTIGYHDYFRVPEIIEDICECFEERYKTNIKEIFISKSKPCIVKFYQKNPREDYLKCALYYIYEVIHQETHSSLINTCIDCKGRTITPDEIISVKYIEI